MKTKQETFNFVTKAVIAQSEPATKNDECRYRATKDDGTLLKCAAGWCIPDDKYDARLEGRTDLDHPDFTGMFDGHDVEVLKALQVAHDSADADVERFNITWVQAFRIRAHQAGSMLGLAVFFV